MIFSHHLILKNQLINQLIWVSLIALYCVLALSPRSFFQTEDKDEHKKLQAFSQPI